jgi:hypothetical protein
MYLLAPFDYRQLTARDRRFQAALATGFLFLVTIASLFFFTDTPETAGVFALLTVGSGAITTIEHRLVRKEANTTK